MLDATKSELVFVKDGKMIMPIRFNAGDLRALDTVAADRLLGQFADELHDEQKGVVKATGSHFSCLVRWRTFLDVGLLCTTNGPYLFSTLCSASG